jgi:hypothetical protein
VDPFDWASMEQRVEPNTRRLLDLLAEFDVRGRSSSRVGQR